MNCRYCGAGEENFAIIDGFCEICLGEIALEISIFLEKMEVEQ
jgi:hypothetical protein